MKITLINPPQVFSKSQFSANIVPPLGIMYLGAVCREKGYKVKLIDAIIDAPRKTVKLQENYSYRGLEINNISKSLDKGTKVIGISNLFSFAFPIVLMLVKTIKKDHPDSIIVLGGAHPSAAPLETIQHKEIDFIIISEGENSFLELCEALKYNTPDKIKSIDGIVYRTKNNLIQINYKTKFIQELDSLPFPARDLLPIENYSKLSEAHGPIQNTFTPILSSRGCPHRCSFCTPKLWDSKYRARSPKNIVDEIEYCVKKFDIKEFHFEDENLTQTKQRIVEICKEIKLRNLKIKWQTPNGIRIDNLDYQLLKNMQESGCDHITIAPESGSERVLKEIIDKNQKLSKFLEFALNSSKLKLKTAAYFLMGIPGEKPEDIRLTIKFSNRLAKLGVDEADFSLFTPLPGSKLYEDLKSNNKLPYSWEDLGNMSDIASCSSWSEHLTSKELNRFRLKAYFLFHLTKLIYHPLKSLSSLFNVLRNKQTLKTERVLISLIKRYIFKI